ncbi:unnamed protein product [Lathyrus sativus]|nr:unnamed protein product [Lathyrus sativus]
MIFGNTWMRWMEACIFKIHVSILFNDNLTKDFEVGIGLRKGNPLSPFLFVLVVEGLSSLIYASKRGDFESFRVDEGLSVEIIQFVDDTLIIGERGWKNLWSIKAILRGFDLVSVFSVNFHESMLIGINVSNHFLVVASNFLSCKIEEPSFNFLGIPIGSNPRGIKS